MKSRLDLVKRFALAACFCLAACGVVAQEAPAESAEPAEKVDPEMEDEISYVEALIQTYPDLAATVIEGARKRWPDAGPRLLSLEVRNKLRLGKFDEVKAELAKIDRKAKPGEYWAMNLAMADTYYAMNDMASCSKIYTDFFASVPNPDSSIRALYIQSADKWASTLVREKREDEATKVYDGLCAQLAKLKTDD